MFPVLCVMYFVFFTLRYIVLCVLYFALSAISALALSDPVGVCGEHVNGI